MDDVVSVSTSNEDSAPAVRPRLSPPREALRGASELDEETGVPPREVPLVKPVGIIPPANELERLRLLHLVSPRLPLRAPYGRLAALSARLGQ